MQNLRFKFFSSIKQDINISKNIFEECSDEIKFFSIKVIQIFDESKLIYEGEITVFNFNMNAFDEFLGDFTNENIRETLQLVEKNYKRIKDMELGFQEFAVIKTNKITEDSCENLRKYLRDNILDLMALYFCVELKAILSKSSDEIFGAKTLKDRIITRK